MCTLRRILPTDLHISGGKETTNILGICLEKSRKSRKRPGPKGATVSQNSCDKIRHFCEARKLIKPFSLSIPSTPKGLFPHPQCQMGAHYDGRDRPPQLSSPLPPLECQGLNAPLTKRRENREITNLSLKKQGNAYIFGSQPFCCIASKKGS